MISFQSNKTNIKAYILKQVLGCTAIFVVLVIYERFISARPANIVFYWTMGCLIIVLLIVELFKKRLVRIQFDDEKEQISFLYKDFFSRENTNEIPYKTARIEIDDDSSLFSWFGKSTTLCFLKNKMEVCSVNKGNGFSHAQIKEIADLVTALVKKEGN